MYLLHHNHRKYGIVLGQNLLADQNDIPHVFLNSNLFKHLLHSNNNVSLILDNLDF